MTPQGCPVVCIIGIDPEKHEIPPLLKHHLIKMQKDFLVSFIGGEDISEQTGAVLADLLKQSKYVPTPRKVVEAAKPDIKIVSR